MVRRAAVVVRVGCVVGVRLRLRLGLRLRLRVRVVVPGVPYGV